MEANEKMQRMRNAIAVINDELHEPLFLLQGIKDLAYYYSSMDGACNDGNEASEGFSRLARMCEIVITELIEKRAEINNAI